MLTKDEITKVTTFVIASAVFVISPLLFTHNKGYQAGSEDCRAIEDKLEHNLMKSEAMLTVASALKLRNENQLMLCNAIGEDIAENGQYNYCLDCHVGH